MEIYKNLFTWAKNYYMANPQMKILCSLVQERERERIVWFEDPNNPNNRNSNQNLKSASSGGGNGGNKPKCSKCGVNEAVHGGIVFSIENEKGVKEKKTFYDGYLCGPCYQELIKCQECKAKEAQTIINRNNSDIILCKECHKKIGEQEKIVKELKVKIDKIISHTPNSDKRLIYVLEKASLDLKQMKELKILLTEAWNKGLEIWHEVVGCPHGLEVYFNILDPRIKELEEKETKKQDSKNNDKIPEQDPNNQKVPEKEPKPNPPAEKQPAENSSPQEKDQLQTCPKCGKTAEQVCPTFKMCEICLNSFNKWTKEELEFGIQVYQQSLRGDPNNGIVNQKLIQIQAEYDRRYKKPIQPQKPNPSREDQNINKEIPKDRQLKPNERCEGCGASCIVYKTENSYTIRRKRYIKHSVDFTSQASIWFGLNCSCIERFKQENQQTCHQCQKRDFPENWVLDYELKMAFCSPMCHISYREAQWARENQTNQTNQQTTQARPNPAPRPNPTSWARSARLFPAELELSGNSEESFDWEKEVLKKEVLTLKEKVKTLKTNPVAKIDKTSKGSGSTELESYFLELCKNTQQQAEQAYESKYGKSELNDLLGSSQQSKKNYWPLIIGVGLVGGGLIIGLVVYFVGKKKNLKN